MRGARGMRIIGLPRPRRGHGRKTALYNKGCNLARNVNAQSGPLTLRVQEDADTLRRRLHALAIIVQHTAASACLRRARSAASAARMKLA